MTFPSFPTGSTIRADATLDDLLDWYHWAVADGADSEAFLLAAMRQFPQWASDLFEHAVSARAAEHLRDAPEPSAEEEARLVAVLQAALAQALLNLHAPTALSEPVRRNQASTTAAGDSEVQRPQSRRNV
jgi:hypothetical protein